MSGTITDLKVQRRNKERVNVYLDGEFAFALPLAEAARLQRGQHLSDEEIARLKAIDAYARARDAALRYLAVRPRSVAEVRRQLQRKGFDQSTIQQVIDRLLEWGYLNDEEFARSWVAERERFRPRGRIALRQELRNKGVSDEIIDRVLADVDPEASARAALAPRLRQWRHLEWRAFRQKATAYLARRGFSYDIIDDVVCSAWQELTHSPADDEL